MEITITGRHLELTDHLKTYAEEKIRRLKRYFDRLIQANIVLWTERHRQIAEVTMHVYGHTIVIQEASEDMYTSIDTLVDRLERQIKKYKERLSQHAPQRHAGQEVVMREHVIEAEGLERADTQAKVIRTHSFAAKPMSVDEAAMQMELSGQNFLVFANAENDEVNVIYRRGDGNYGLIEPE